MPENEIRCPACHSAISADGKQIVEESGHLVSLRKDAGLYAELREEVKELKGEIKKLRAEIEAAPTAPDPTPAPAPTPAPVIERRPAARDRHFVIG
jgi:hypothetical protein